ncbi:MAG: hypothetical protein AAB441_02910 [Patescibacteria group bacterium]
MKQLMFLISTAGKTTKQISKEAWEAFQKFQKVHKESLKNLKQTENKKLDTIKEIKKNRIVDVTLQHLGEGFVI